MASIPLPALDIKPPQPTDALGSFEKIQALRQMQQGYAIQNQDLQLKQQQVKDQQTVMNWMQRNQGKTFGDAADALKGQISLPAYSKLIDTDAEIRQKHAQATEAELKNRQSTHDAYQQIYNNAMNLPDDQLAALSPQIAQQVNSVPGGALKLDPSQPLTKAHLQEAGAFLGINETYLKQEADKRKEAAETTEATQKGNEAAAGAEAKRQESEFYKNSGVGAPGVSPETVQMVNALRQVPGLTPATYPAWKAGQVSQAEAPVKIATARAEGEARANIEAQVARGSSAALAQVPPHLVAPATAAATKAGEDYAQANSVTSRLNAMMDAARKGNVVAYQVMPEEGTLQITTSQGVHRINKTEIDQYAGGGSLWQRLEGHVGKTLSGKSIPDSVLNDMADIQKIQAEGAQSKYNDALKTINQNYGAQFKPVEMTKGLPSDTPGAKTPQAPPQGATHTAMGSDGKRHYTNQQGQDLGVAQ